ncbi:hypothetical protein EMIHUDRAFT_436326, partial [Emiliania huxleyi CCMP1516]|uniref:Uncharacterized protein n=2 Tax=Emiliania huxleyi TaxID=2903 RepID=A0A0D3J2V9_EMIH1
SNHPAPATTCHGSPRICCDRRRARRRPAAARKRPAQPLLGPAAAGRVAAQRVERTEPAQSGASHERPRPPRRRRPRPTVVANQRGAVHRCACPSAPLDVGREDRFPLGTRSLFPGTPVAVTWAPRLKSAQQRAAPPPAAAPLTETTRCRRSRRRRRRRRL